MARLGQRQLVLLEAVRRGKVRYRKQGCGYRRYDLGAVRDCTASMGTLEAGGYAIKGSRRISGNPGSAYGEFLWELTPAGDAAVDAFLAGMRDATDVAAAGGLVRPGQVWADNDRRCAGRTMRVVEVDGTHAVCEILTNSDEAQQWLNDPAGRPSWMNYSDRRGKTVRISLARMRPTSTGYRLIKEDEQ